jgi:hypothetical protein
MAQQLLVDQGLLTVQASLSHSDTPRSVDSSGRVIIPKQRPPPDKRQHSHQTNTPAPGGIRTRKPSNQAAEAPRLWRRGRWDRQSNVLLRDIYLSVPLIFFCSAWSYYCISNLCVEPHNSCRKSSTFLKHLYELHLRNQFLAHSKHTASPNGRPS